MRERGMIFNDEMVRAVLEGRKTQTRRIIQERHLYGGGREPGNWPVHMPEGEEGEKARLWAANNSPFGTVGDRLWVRETWSDVNLEGAPAVAYRADGGVRPIAEDDGDEADPKLEKYWFANWYPDLISGTEGRWRPSIHMPRWASRITLEITGVRVERLNSINYRDAVREGLVQEEYNWHSSEYPLDDIAFRASSESKRRYSSPQECFKDLWQSIYGEESWQANPWVWVIEFKRVEGE